MFFQKRLDRARELQRRQRGLDDESKKENGEEEVLLTRKERRQKEKENAHTLANETEKGDMFAMYFAAFITVFLPAALILVGIVLLVMLMFGLF